MKANRILGIMILLVGLFLTAQSTFNSNNPSPDHHIGKINQLDNKFIQLTEKYKELLEKCKEGTTPIDSRVAEELANLKADKIVMTQLIDNLKTDNARLQVKINSLEANLKDAQELNNILNSELIRANSKITNLQGQVKVLATNLTNCKQLIKKEGEKSSSDWASEKASLQQTINQLQRDKSQLEQKVENIRKDAQSSSHKLISDKLGLQNTVSNLEQQKTELSSQVEGFKKNIETWKEAMSNDIAKAISSINATLSSADAKDIDWASIKKVLNDYNQTANSALSSSNFNLISKLVLSFNNSTSFAQSNQKSAMDTLKKSNQRLLNSYKNMLSSLKECNSIIKGRK